MEKAESVTSEDRAATAERIRSLADQVSRHIRLYHLEDSPEISDAEYDRLFRELQLLEEAHPEHRLPDSPTQRVGAPPAEGFKSVAHRVPMLSLDNAMDAEELRSFDERIRRILDREGAIALSVEPKLDGAGVELVYAGGLLEVGSTRGDGHVGEDVTANLKQLLSIPLKLDDTRIPVPDAVSIRGEVVLPIRHFQRLNAARLARGDEPFVNPRNAAAGALRQLHDIDLARLRVLEFRAYGIGEGLPEGVETQIGVLETLAAWGLQVSPDYALCADVDAAVAYHRKCWSAATPRSRDRRHRDQGERAGTPAGPRRALPDAALGDRLQVPRPAGDDAGGGDLRQRRPHGSAHAGREAATRLRGRGDGREAPRSTTRTRSTGRTCGSATPWSSSAPAT